MSTRVLSKVLAALALVVVAASASAQDHDDLVPGEKNYRDWVEFIRPSAEELSFERIGWRNSFWPAVEEARRLGRPILLWTMNGHPLGCT